jgi:SAM-dependent methyltransferase
MDCNLLFLDMRFDDQELDRLYYNYRDENYANLRNKYEPGYKRINKVINSPYNYIKKVENFLSTFFTSSINILDFGGDDGKNTPFKDTKNIIHIYDISKKPTVKNLKKVNKSNMLKKYDLVILSNVIEHVSYPQLIINEIKKLLNKSSIFYIELPLEKIMKKNWEFEGGRLKKNKLLICLKNKKHWHEHINFYSKKSLVKLLNFCGLKIIKMNILPIEIHRSAEVVQIACKKI